MKSDLKPPEVRTVSVRLPVELAEWVNSEFSKGFKQTFVLQCFLSLRHIMTEGEVPPPHIYAKTATFDALSTMSSLRVGEE